MGGKSNTQSIEHWVVSLITKFGFPLALAIFLLYWFFIFYFPRTEERMREQANACLQAIKDTATSVQNLERTIQQKIIKFN